MSIWTTLLGAFSLWVFVCLSVAIPLRNAADNPWHLRFIQRMYFNNLCLTPRGNCSYFWFLFFAPISGVSFLFGTILVHVCRPVIFLSYDWLIMPMKGLRVEHPFSKIYWIKIFTRSVFSRNTRYVDIPAKRFTLALLAITAVIAWVWAGKETAYVCFGIVHCGGSWLGLAATFWTALTTVGLFCVLYLFTGNLLGPKVVGAWDFLSGKLCHQIEYEKSESHDNS